MKIAWKALSVMVVLSIGLLGCTQSGYLTVENNSVEPVAISVDGDDRVLDPNDDRTWEWEFPNVVLNVVLRESQAVDVEYFGMFVLPGEETIEIEGGDDERFEIDSDAGAAVVENHRASPVTEVNITASTDTEWGPNLVSGASIGTGQARAFGPFGVGPHDVRIISQDGIIWQLYNATYPTIAMAVEQVIAFSVDPDDYVRWDEQGGGAVLPLSGSSSSVKVLR